jgi:methionyl-tRNA formyltransferase
MRIAVATQEEPFYLPPALDALCSAREDDVVALIVLPAFNEGLFATARRMYDFYGPFDFVRLVGRYMWAKTADVLNQMRPVTRPYSASDVANRHGIRVYRPSSINTSAFLTTLREGIRPDLLVSIAASQVLGEQVLDLPPFGCINLHSAPLPRYQGMMPTFWTLLHEEPHATVTVHYMVGDLDAGDIILQRPVPILSDDSLHDLIVRSKRVGIQTLLDAIDQIERGTVQRRSMDRARATYFSFPERADARRLRSQGRQLI